jgi:hypothetical protein
MAAADDRVRPRDGLRPLLRRPWRMAESRRLALDAFVARYAHARGLSFAATGRTPPATWFLETVVPDKSHGFLSGELGEGVSGELFYAEREVPSRRTSLMQGWTVARVALEGATELAYGIACVWRRPETVWRGRVKLPSALPRDTTEVVIGDETLDGQRLTAVSSHADVPALPRLFTDAFVAWLNEMPWDRTGAGVIRFELRGGVVCVYARGKAASTAELDRFRARAAHIAARIRDASAAGA